MRKSLISLLYSRWDSARHTRRRGDRGKKANPTHAPRICVPRTASAGSLILVVQENIEATTPWRRSQTDAATAVMDAVKAKRPCPGPQYPRSPSTKPGASPPTSPSCRYCCGKPPSANDDQNSGIIVQYGDVGGAVHKSRVR